LGERDTRTFANVQSQESAPAADAFDPAIESDVRWIAVPFYRDVGRNWHGTFRCAMMRSSNDGVGRAEHDHNDRQKHTGRHSFVGEIFKSETAAELRVM
jgi:hypothetical protein